MSMTGWEALRAWATARAVPAKNRRCMEDDAHERGRLLGVYQTCRAVVDEMRRLEQEGDGSGEE
jgi:hypothetical protein